jgi:hypothetical protein
MSSLTRTVTAALVCSLPCFLSAKVPFGTAHNVYALQAAVPTVTSVAGSLIGIADQVKKLGNILDSHLSFNSHVNSLCKAAYYHIRALRHVRPCLSQSLAYTVACARWR